MLNKMPTPSMGGGGATSADKIICLDADGNQSDVQTELDKVNSYTSSIVRIGTWMGKPLYKVSAYDGSPSGNKVEIDVGLPNMVAQVVSLNPIYHFSNPSAGQDFWIPTPFVVASSGSVTQNVFPSFNSSSGKIEVNFSGSSAIEINVTMLFTLKSDL